MENNCQNIAIVFTSLNIGGIERKIVDLSTHYSTQKNIRLHLFLKINQGTFLDKIPPNVKIHFLSASKNQIINLIYPVWLWKQFLILKPDLVLSFGNFSSICAIIANFFSIQTKLIISEDSSIDVQISNDSFPLIRQVLVRLTYPLATGAIVLTPTARQKIGKYLPLSKVTILPNWLPINIPVSNLPSSLKPIDILFVGRLVAQKDPLKFLDFCRQIQKDLPTIKITMIGDGELKPQIINYLTRHHLSVELLPSSSPVDQYYQQSKVLVLTSVHEGFPLTILESFYYSCPVICPSLNEVKPFYIFEPEKFIYSQPKDAIKLITAAILYPDSLKKSVQKYRDYVVTTRDQNFHATLDYLQQFL
jgi:glycosyltransferase involved in cell wall biosynthesis